MNSIDRRSLGASAAKAALVVMTALACAPSSLSAAQAAPSSIRVGQGCSCSSCGSVVTVSMETYVKRVLPHEWIASWHGESLRAGSVAARSYAAWYVYHPISSSYDICNSTCCQVYGTSQNASTDAAANATAGIYLLDSSDNITRAEYSAENNDLNSRDGCGNCYTANRPNDGVCLSDNACCGATQNGHGRGMCQWGSQRWAANRGMGWVWIVDHYYVAYGWRRVSLTGSTPPPSTASRNTNSHFVTSDGKLVSFAVFSDGTVQTKSQVAAGGAWGGWNYVGQGGGFTGIDVVQRTDGKFTCFGVGNGTPAWFSWQDSAGAWSGWNSLGGTLSFVQGHRYNDGRYSVIAVGDGSEVFINSQVAPSGSWTGWQTISPGGGFTHISTIKRPDETFVVFGIGNNTPVWITWQNAVGGPFVAWQSLGGPGFANIRAVRRGDGSNAVFGVGNGTEVWALAQATAGGAWGSWGVVASGGGFTRVDPVVRANNSIVLFGVGNGSPVWITEQTVAGGSWQAWANLGNNAVTSCDGFLTGDGKFRVFANGNGTAEWLNWQDTANGPWAGWNSIGGSLK